MSGCEVFDRVEKLSDEELTVVLGQRFPIDWHELEHAVEVHQMRWTAKEILKTEVEKEENVSGSTSTQDDE